MSCDVEIRLRKIIKEKIGLSDKVDQLGLNDDLGALGVNSLIFIKIVVAIEEEFSFEFDDENLDYNNFKTLNSIVEYIKESNHKGV